MRITFTGHVGMFIETEGGSILCDPWFNPAYFASWFVFPRNDRLDVAPFLAPDYLYLSHLHHDHFFRNLFRPRLIAQHRLSVSWMPPSSSIVKFAVADKVSKNLLGDGGAWPSIQPSLG